MEATKLRARPPDHQKPRSRTDDPCPPGSCRLREEFDLLYRREATHANAMWQADHTPLDVMLLDEEGKSAKPYLTAIEDDCSRLVVGYQLSFQAATALTTALTLRQAIWSKDDPRWSACGIPAVFYTDHGSDFTSKHLEQVARDIGMELVFSKIGVPRGRGKVERFFRSVDQIFLQDVPGYSPKGYPEANAVLTLPAFEQRFRKWLLEDFHHRVHSETGFIPKDRWEAGGYVPRMPTSMTHLDLLLLTVAKTRKVQQDGIHFQNHRYMDITLAAFVKSASRIEKEVLTLFAAFSYLVEAANQRHQGTEDFLVTHRFSHLIELLIVDEANRLRDAGLEVIRDLADRGEFGLVLLGMPGLEKRLMRAPQLYSRVGFAHEMEPLSEEEMHDFLGKRWGHRVKPHSDDFIDKEAVATIVRVTRSNLRLIDRLMLQVEHVLLANQLRWSRKKWSRRHARI